MRALGTNHGLAKLNEEQVREIFKLAHSGTVSQRTIAKRFGVSQPIVWAVKHRRIWGWLWQEEEA